MVIGICDDEQNSREIIREYCERFASEHEESFEYQEFDSGERLLICDAEIDVLLLDVEMNGIDGIEAMKRLSEYSNIKNILFMSSHKNYVFDAFGDKTRGYIQKSEGYENFEKYMLSTIEGMSERVAKRFIKIYENGEYVYVDTKKIVYLEAAGKYVYIYTEGKKYCDSGNIGLWEDKLGQYDIKRIHNSYLVNYAYIKNMGVKSVELIKEVQTLPIGRRYYEKRKQEYKMYRIRKARENGR